LTNQTSDPPPIRVLLLCVGNSARSIMGEALLRHEGGDRFLVRSAGSAPKGVNPLSLRVLDERGVSTADLRSESVAAYQHEPWDYVITLCDAARETCPYMPGAHELLHWDLPDPAAVEGDEATRLDAFRAVLESLEAHLETFVRWALERGAQDTPRAGRPASGVL
jgi:arsenate reductase